MLIQSEGFYTAEEAIWVMEHMGRMNSDVEIKGAQQETTCPARHRDRSRVNRGSMKILPTLCASGLVPC
jgi:hypothetical protein